MKPKPFYEVSVPEGLEEIAWQEISTRFEGRVKLLNRVGSPEGLLQFTYGDLPRKLLSLKGVLSLFWGLRFDAPRPRALLGQENFQMILDTVASVLKLSPSGSFKSLYLAAAGSDSTVMRRFADEIAAKTGLKPTPHEGDLLIRVRRPLDETDAWEVLVRMTPRPLSVRAWRVCDYPGALNAAVAHAMILLTSPKPEDVFLNLGCGSGTLLIERAVELEAAEITGCDLSAEALTCARKNIAAAGFGPKKKQPALRGKEGILLNSLKPQPLIQVNAWDARALPIPEKSVDVICADLPFGHDVGSHDENLLLYPQLLREAARVAKPGARGVFLTHEIRLMETVLNVSSEWQLQAALQIRINGLNPRMYVLQRVKEA